MLAGDVRHELFGSKRRAKVREGMSYQEFLSELDRIEDGKRQP